MYCQYIKTSHQMQNNNQRHEYALQGGFSKKTVI